MTYIEQEEAKSMEKTSHFGTCLGWLAGLGRAWAVVVKMGLKIPLFWRVLCTYGLAWVKTCMFSALLLAGLGSRGRHFLCKRYYLVAKMGSGWGSG